MNSTLTLGKTPAVISVMRPMNNAVIVDSTLLMPKKLNKKLIARLPPLRSSDCVVDFNDSNALRLTEASLWFDRVYGGWYQNCAGSGYIRIKTLVNSHFHLGYEDPDIVPCFGNDQAYPSRMDTSGNCEYVDILQEPRTHLSSHTSTEIIDIRVYDESGYLPFNLNQIAVVGVTPIRFCYKKAQQDNSPAEWVVNDPPGNSSPGVWQCWNQLDTGVWDLSNWVTDAIQVKISASNLAGSFSIDNIYIE